jgi:HPr kinase/phosphorylase
VVLLGESELGYLSQLPEEIRRARLREFCAHPELPCTITSHPERVQPDFLEAADEYGLPLLGSELAPRVLMPRIVEHLRHFLAPQKQVHGVAMDVYGMGLLITGKSGVGKSECALELVKRGHRLVADDVILLRKVSDESLLLSCTEQLCHTMELRGIGLIDVRALFGIGAIAESRQLDLVIRMEAPARGRVYERLGLEQHFLTVMGVEVPLMVVPVTEGKNMSIVIEAAAMNQHLLKLGINTARELTERQFKRLNPELAQPPQNQPK